MTKKHIYKYTAIELQHYKNGLMSNPSMGPLGANVPKLCIQKSSRLVEQVGQLWKTSHQNFHSDEKKKQNGTFPYLNVITCMLGHINHSVHGCMLIGISVECSFSLAI